MCMISKAHNLALTTSSFGITLAMMSLRVSHLFHFFPGTNPINEARRLITNFEYNFSQLCTVFSHVDYFTPVRPCAEYHGQLVCPYSLPASAHVALKQLSCSKPVPKAYVPMDARRLPDDAEKILQWGMGRTATTFQTMAIQSSLCAAHRNTTVKKLINEPGLLEMQALLAKDSRTVAFVTHISQGNATMGRQQHFGLFSNDQFRHTAPITESRADAAGRLEREWSLRPGSIVYVQETATIAQRDWRLIEDYKPIFGLSDEAFGKVVAYMRVWDVLRKCCGPQMSSDYRARLLGNDQYVPHRKRASVVWDACELYDINSVEKVFVANALKRRCSNLAQISIGLSWVKLTGAFCSAHREAVIATRAAFNENPFELRRAGKMGTFDTTLK